MWLRTLTFYHSIFTIFLFSDLCVTFGNSMLPYFQYGFDLSLVQVGSFDFTIKCFISFLDFRFSHSCIWVDHFLFVNLWISLGLDSQERQTKMTVKWCRKEIKKIMWVIFGFWTNALWNLSSMCFTFFALSLFDRPEFMWASSQGSL